MFFSTTRRPLGTTPGSILPPGDRTCRSGLARRRTPRAESVAYALVISTGFTATLPRVMEHTAERSERIPRRCAMSTTDSGPTSTTSCAKTVLTE